MQQGAYILLGGNLGDVLHTFKEALRLLSGLGEIEVQSKVYRSAPWGMDSVHAFLNQAVCLKTELPPGLLLAELLAIEKTLGRVRTAAQVGYADRVLDLDILLIDDLVLNEAALSLPHPSMHLRKFTLLPLAEIAPDLVHPVFQKTIAELLISCKDEKEVAVYEI